MNIIIDSRMDRIWDYIDPEKKVFLLTDDLLANIYSKEIEKLVSKNRHSIYIMKNGEEYKNKETIFKIYDDMIDAGINRYDLFIGFGGGVVGDIGGFVSSTYMRGIDYIQIPTTLISQVDSSIGGKTGFDYRGYKNIIGSFKNPILSFINPSYLLSLRERDMVSGIGEVLKYGLIYDYDFFRYVSDKKEDILNKDLEILNCCIEKSIEVKKYFVDRDFNDLGLRRKLNFGHTIGHSIEAFYNFKKYRHGEAVILGMIYESYIGYLSGEIDLEYFKEILENLAFFIKPIRFSEEDIDRILAIMKKDKKNNSENITCIIPIKRGEVDFFNSIDPSYIKKALKGEFYDS